MCDGSFGDFGGASTPMNTMGNTMGVGDICWDNTTGTGSGDRFDMTVGGWYGKKPAKKRSVNGNGYDSFKSQGSKTAGGFDMSQRPLYVPVSSKK